VARHPTLQAGSTLSLCRRTKAPSSFLHHIAVRCHVKK
jgi:hypothetical protein